MRIIGDIEEDAIKQLEMCMKHPLALDGIVMPDGHPGYSMPIGGVIAYDNAVSPTGVGFDVACGNKAVRLDISPRDIYDYIEKIMNNIWDEIPLGKGKNNKTRVDDELFDDPRWDTLPISNLKQLARNQLGTVGAGNHYIDIFDGDDGYVWVGVHFGSRGFGYKVANGFMNLAIGEPFDIRYKEKDNEGIVLELNTQLGQEYWAAMNLAGDYAYAGRNWVCQKVADIIGAHIVEEVHNHHNFAWKEQHPEHGEVIVVRKGATPAHNGQLCFVGSTMTEPSVILEGLGDPYTLESAPHGAGRTMGRMMAKGKKNRAPLIDKDDMIAKINEANIVLRGSDVDESPDCYKRLDTVLEHIPNAINVVQHLYPLGVAMAPPDRRRR